MNIERMRALADHVEQLPHVWSIRRTPATTYDPGERVAAFNQAAWLDESVCGTAGCIAGCAVTLWPPATTYKYEQIEELAASALGLHPLEAGDLFCPRVIDTPGTLRDVTPQEAAAVLRAVAAGTDPVVAWQRVLL